MVLPKRLIIDYRLFLSIVEKNIAFRAEVYVAASILNLTERTVTSAIEANHF